MSEDFGGRPAAAAETSSSRACSADEHPPQEGAVVDRHLSPEHERVAREATERIRAAVAAGGRQPGRREGDRQVDASAEAAVTERSSSTSARS